jgi:RNA polymerase sigma-70 factor, ECF subfamily
MPIDARSGDLESALKPLWLRAQAGDEAAYRDCLLLLAARLRAYLRHRLAAHPEEVEDLVQETLLALHLQRGTHDPSLTVSAWAVAIARHKLVDHWRRRGRRDVRHVPLDDVDEGLLAVDDEDRGASRDLEKLLRELPAAQRQAIVLTKLDGLSVAEAAERTGASESAIKVQVHRGLKRLAALVRGGTA